MNKPKFSKNLLKLNPEAEVDKITKRLRDLMKNVIKRRGIVLGLSGGIDSSVTCALSVKAFGPKKVFALHMPERHSDDETLSLSTSVSDHFGIESAHEDISGILEAVGFYKRYDAAVKKIIPDYGEGWKSKMVKTNVLENQGYNFFSIVARSPKGNEIRERLSLTTYLEILASTNFKQRTRKMLEYYYADRLNYAVAGTPNRLEYDQGFFVKCGDGAADIKPIAHLYKTQVYQLAKYLGVPEEIIKRPPTTDTYSLEQGQDEFYFSLPFQEMDLCLYAKNNGYNADEVAEVINLPSEKVQYVFNDIDQKRSTTRYLHLGPQFISNIPELK